MYAIVEILGQQFKVEKSQQIFVHRLTAKDGDKVDFNNVLLLDNNGKINVGDPHVKGMKVTAKVIEHLKADKVVVFKKKRRKGYKVKNGHRQQLTKIEILNINKGSSRNQDALKDESSILDKKVTTKKSTTKKATTKKATD